MTVSFRPSRLAPVGVAGGHAGFQLGPRGGAAINIKCCGCGQLFSVTNMGWDMIMGQRLEKPA